VSAVGPPEPVAGPPGELPPQAHLRMARVLRIGLAVALALLGAGLVALVVRSSASDAASWIASNPLVRYFDLRAFGAALASGTPEAYLTLGVYALVATPVVRVLAGIEAFAAHGERRMTILASVVLVLLLFGLLVVGPLVR
jgi:uncharacterized membrane protein